MAKRDLYEPERWLKGRLGVMGLYHTLSLCCYQEYVVCGYLKIEWQSYPLFGGSH